MPKLSKELKDLRNRLEQFIEINDHIIKVDSDQPTGWQGVSCQQLAQIQNQAFDSVLTLIEQIGGTGKVMRGSSAVPDAIEVILRDIRPNLSLL